MIFMFQNRIEVLKNKFRYDFFGSENNGDFEYKFIFDFWFRKKIGFLKNKFRFDFWFRKRIEI